MRRILYLAWGMLLTTALHAQINCNTETFLRTFGSGAATESGLTLCPSGDGNLYASGLQDNQTVLMKLSPAGDVLWSRSFTLNTSPTPCVINEMSVDADGMLFAAGIETDTQPNATSVAFRYDPNANAMLWIKRFEGDSVFANGIIEKSPGGNYIFYQNTISLGSLSARAEVLELNRLTGNVVPTLARRYALNNAAEFTRMISYEGALYSIGTAQTLSIPIPSFRPLLTRMDSTNAQPVWSTLTYVSTTPTDLIGLDLLIDNDTILSLSGGAFLGVGTPGPIHLYLQKNTLSGDLLWLKQYEVPAFTDEFGAEIVQLNDGYAIYGAGQRDSTVSQLLMVLDHDGNVVVAKSLGAIDQSAILPFQKGDAIAFDNHLFFTGAIGVTNTDWSILKTDSVLTLTDSCGYLQPLDSVTATISPNPLNASTTLQVTQGAITTTDATATLSDITLGTELLCPVCADTCNVTLDLGQDVVFCLDTTITVDAGPGFVSYLWNDSTTTSTFTVALDSQSVSISVTVVDSCGNTQRDTLNFTFIGDLPTIADQILCQGDSFTLSYPGLGGSQFLSDSTLVFDSLGTIVLTPDTTTNYILYLSTIDGCAVTDTFQITVTTPVQLSDTLTACAGDFILLDSVAYTQDTTVTVTLPASVGCDTLLTYQLTFTPLPTQNDTISVCAGDSIVIGGITYTQDTVLVDTLASTTAGCDTLITRNLVFTPGATVTDTLTACVGDIITIDSVDYTVDTTLVTFIPSTTGGCDTVLTQVLTFTPGTNLNETYTACVGDVITLDSVNYTTDTTIVTVIPATGGGCDTTLTQVLTFTPSVAVTDTLTACVGDVITIDSVDYSTDTTVVSILPSTTGGCDTTLTRVLVFTPGPTLTETLTACIGGVITIDSVDYTTDTTLVSTIPSTTGGCDTTLTRVLTFTPGATATDTLTACIGDVITLDSIDYTTDTTLVTTIPSTGGGCDTVLTQVLVFTPQPTVTVTLTACAGDAILLDSISYTQDTTLIDTVASNSGSCDTIRTRQLVFSPLPTVTETISACEGDAILLNGVTYTQDTTVVDTVASNSGSACDTLRTRQLTFNPLPIVSDTIVLCAGDSIVIDSVTYTQSTTIVQDTLASTTGGCDTLVETILIFNPAGTTTDTIQACEGDTITIGGNPYFQSGTVTDTLSTSGSGCDSVAIHVLIFVPRPTLSDTIRVCPGDSITIGGVTYFQNGTAIDTLASTSGSCDTIATYTLVFANPTLQDTIQFAPGDTVFVYGTPYTFPVIVVDTLPATAGGCDTIATTVLQYLTPFTITCQPDITVTAPAGSTTTIVDYNLPTVTTNCPGGFSTFTLLSGLPVGGSFPVGVTQVCIQAADSCGNVDTCCFNVTVLSGQQACDTKQNGCIRWDLFPIKLDSVGQRRYQIRVTNNCAQEVDYVLFQVPNGITAVAPANNSVYTDAVSGRQYDVRNPNFSPFYSIRFKAVPATNLNNGVFDVFEYKLPQQSQPNYIHTLVKFADGTTVEAHLNTYSCPVLPYPNFGPNPTDALNRVGNDLSLYPNPTSGQLLFDLAAWENQVVRVDVINAQGRLVQTLKVTAEAGMQGLELDSRLPDGLYQLVVRPNEGVPVAEPFILERN